MCFDWRNTFLSLLLMKLPFPLFFQVYFVHINHRLKALSGMNFHFTNVYEAFLPEYPFLAAFLPNLCILFFSASLRYCTKEIQIGTSSKK